MAAQQQSLKINNSYESEPSSSSGFSVGENNGGSEFDNESVHLPSLLKPASCANGVPLFTSQCSKPKPLGKKYKKPRNKVHRSKKNSPFEGFSNLSSHNYKVLEVLSANPSQAMRPEEKSENSKFYDTIVEENSCNAVFLPLSNEKQQHNFSGDSCATSQQTNTTSELSFNGKIKSLACNESASVSMEQQITPSLICRIPLASLDMLKLYNRLKQSDSSVGNLADNVQSTISHQQKPQNALKTLICRIHLTKLSDDLVGKLSNQSIGSQSNVTGGLQSRAQMEKKGFQGIVTRSPRSTFQEVELSTTLTRERKDIPPISFNASQLTDSFVLKKYSNERSPDIFGDDEDDETDTLTAEEIMQSTSRVEIEDLDTVGNNPLYLPTDSSFVDEKTKDCIAQVKQDSKRQFQENCNRERELLRRTRKCLTGVPPPPSLTTLQLDLFKEVVNHKQGILNFFKTPMPAEIEQTTTTTSLFQPTHTLTDAKAMEWNKVLGVRQHGLCYNLTKASESHEYLALAVIDRYIGSETASSYHYSPSSAKKRAIRAKQLIQSPGNRLSHLAKRRSVFSSANLASTTQRSNSLLGPQIQLDEKKTKNRRKSTPKRMTPSSKRKNRKTPSSSARKRLLYCERAKPAPSRETSKRALFQSPAKQLQQKPNTQKPTFKPEIANRVERSKRALFSPDRCSQSSNSSLPLSSLGDFTQPPSYFGGNSSSSCHLDSLLKRKRDDDNDDTMEQTAKKSRFSGFSAENLTPRALKIKSQSFCMGAGSSSSSAVAPFHSVVVPPNNQLALSTSQLDLERSINSSSGLKIQRAQSEMVVPSNNLTENQRKKLLWAVSQALQEKKITTKHERFKQYASVLARVVRRIFQEFYQKNSTSNSETLLRLAKKYVYSVICGKNMDDIYFQARAQIYEYQRQLATRLSGYICPEDYQRMQNSQLSYRSQNIFAIENSLDSNSMMGSSQTSSAYCTMSTEIMRSQNSFLDSISQDIVMTQDSYISSKSLKIQKQQPSQQHQSMRLPIQPNAALQNSSSKNNLCGLALRENVDCEQRRSAQKFAHGKDSRNRSPFTASSSSALKGSEGKTSKKFAFDLHGSGSKAKRQISFDN